MTYANAPTGRVDLGPSDTGRASDGDGFWTFEAVEERLIEAIELWRRTPGGGLAPSNGGEFAADAPWRLLTKAVRASAGELALMDVWRIEQDEAKRSAQPQRIMGLSSEEVARRDEASEWLRLVPERDRKMLVLALTSLAGGAQKVPWLALWKALGRGRPGPDGLRWRFDQGLQRIAVTLNRRKSA